MKLPQLFRPDRETDYILEKERKQDIADRWSFDESEAGLLYPEKKRVLVYQLGSFRWTNKLPCVKDSDILIEIHPPDNHPRHLMLVSSKEGFYADKIDKKSKSTVRNVEISVAEESLDLLLEDIIGLCERNDAVLVWQEEKGVQELKRKVERHYNCRA